MTAASALLAGWSAGMLSRELAGDGSSELASSRPWLYGSEPGSRYVITFYADLECPHCKSYFPSLKAWVDCHPRTELQWHHLPLPFHEPAATNLAILAECMGNVGGQAAFWRTVEWIFLNTQGGGRGLPDGLAVPGMTFAVQECLAGDAPREVVQTHARLAGQEGIDATPTLKLEDRTIEAELILSGPIEGDVLLSAFDLLLAEHGSN